jgi:copper homeostasis protein CutC
VTTARPARYLLEIAVSTPDEAIRAAENGADRLELSSALEVGGLTPSLHSFMAVREAVALPVYVLVRPRSGGFHYSKREFEVMLRDAEEFMKRGASGIVFGMLNSHGIDRQRCRQMVEVALGHAVFHRAFDFLAEPLKILDELIELGFERILTSGQAASAEVGAACLTSLLEHAEKQIEILPAGNIRPVNVVDLIRKTACEQVHSSARALIHDTGFCENPKLSAGMGTDDSGQRMSTDGSVVAALRKGLDEAFASTPPPPLPGGEGVAG